MEKTNVCQFYVAQHVDNFQRFQSSISINITTSITWTMMNPDVMILLPLYMSDYKVKLLKHQLIKGLSRNGASKTCLSQDEL